MTEKIKSIDSLDEIEIEGDGCYEGYKVVTDNQTILVLVSNSDQCCESWGRLASDDDLQQFIGANLIRLTHTDTALNTKVVPDYLDDGGTMFLTFETDRGNFQLVVYNAHNGYYGHRAKIISKHINEDTYL